MFMDVSWGSVRYNIAAVDFFVEKWAVSKKIGMCVIGIRTGSLEYIVLGAGRAVESAHTMFCVLHVGENLAVVI
jgi:hypothetical protein